MPVHALEPGAEQSAGGVNIAAKRQTCRDKPINPRR
jgi:hypothetical protein